MKSACFILVSVVLLSSPLFSADLYLGFGGGLLHSNTVDQGAGHYIVSSLRLQLNDYIGFVGQLGGGKFGQAELRFGRREGSEITLHRFYGIISYPWDTNIYFFLTGGVNYITAIRDYDFNDDGLYPTIGFGGNIKLSDRIVLDLNLKSSFWMRFSYLDTATIGVHYMISKGVF